jgi:hypothetical protein
MHLVKLSYDVDGRSPDVFSLVVKVLQGELRYGVGGDFVILVQVLLEYVIYHKQPRRDMPSRLL